MTRNATADLLTVPEVAQRLRLHRISIYRAVERGELAAYRLGGNGPLRIPEAAIADYLRPTTKEPR
jgi:excisionase family DNA binding protein